VLVLAVFDWDLLFSHGRPTQHLSICCQWRSSMQCEQSKQVKERDSSCHCGTLYSFSTMCASSSGPHVLTVCFSRSLAGLFQQHASVSSDTADPHSLLFYIDQAGHVCRICWAAVMFSLTITEINVKLFQLTLSRLQWKTKSISGIIRLIVEIITDINLKPERTLYTTRNTFCGTWYLPHSRVHKSMIELCA